MRNCVNALQNTSILATATLPLSLKCLSQVSTSLEKSGFELLNNFLPSSNEGPGKGGLAIKLFSSCLQKCLASDLNLFLCFLYF